MKLFRNKVIVLLLASNILLLSKGYALETNTHELINERIAKTTIGGFPLGTYLKNQIGISKGIDEIFNKKSVLEWIKKGGTYEDKPPWTVPYTRSFNHFHDPISNRGFKGLWNSSVIWSQFPKGTQYPGGYYSWHDTRDYFYKALTSASKTGRESNFADTFRGLGQLMHLVEDVSVPAHVRDDGHPFGFHYEKWVQKNYDTYDKILNLVPITFDPSILSLPANSLAPIPIARIFDTDQYKRESPDPAVTVGGAIGLSEYTNANFVSEGLLSANFQDFPYPRIQDTTIIGKSITSPSGTYTRQYYLKNCCGETNSGKGYLLAAVDYLDYWRQKHPLLSVGLPKIPGLDDNVYKDYAALLIPRAVGYSAWLLNYFFRGEIDMVPDDVKGSGYVIENNTDEDMSGQFELWYDNKNDERAKIQIPALNNPLNLGKKSSGNNKSTNITFTPPDNAKKPGKYMLVFGGKLGNEENAVVGKEVSLIPLLVFLIYQDVQNNPVYAVWSVENDGKKLVSYDFDISKYATYFNIYGYRNPSVVKSDDNYQNHVYTVENFRIDNKYFRSKYPDSLPQYGRIKMSSGMPGGDKYVLFGVRNCFIGKDFEYNAGDSGYICSGKNAAYKNTEGEWVKDLALWKINNHSGQIKYSINGVEKTGATIAFQSPEDIYAVLSPDKYIGVDDSSRQTFTGPYIFDASSCAVNIWVYNRDYSEYNYLFGDTVLEEIRMGNFYQNNKGSEGCPSSCSSHIEFGITSATCLPLDYSNLNIDENFVIIYLSIKGTNPSWGSIYDGYNSFDSDCGQTEYWAFDKQGTYYEYKIAFKTKNNGLVKETIATFTSGKIYDYAKHKWILGGPYTKSFAGQRISGVSSYASDKYLLYTSSVRQFFV